MTMPFKRTGHLTTKQIMAEIGRTATGRPKKGQTQPDTTPGYFVDMKAKRSSERWDIMDIVPGNMPQNPQDLPTITTEQATAIFQTTKQAYIEHITQQPTTLLGSFYDRLAETFKQADIPEQAGRLYTSIYLFAINRALNMLGLEQGIKMMPALPPPKPVASLFYADMLVGLKEANRALGKDIDPDYL